MSAMFPRVVWVGLLLSAALATIAWVEYWVLSTTTFYPGGPTLLGRYFAAALVFAVAALAVFSVVFYSWVAHVLVPLATLIKTKGLRVGWLVFVRARCVHEWVYDPQNNAKRECSKCGSRQSLYTRAYHSATTPDFVWRDQNFDELRFL